DGEVEDLDGRGLAAVPGLVDCHTHACFAGDRVDEFALRARGATYEELHAAGGGILSTVRATRAAGEEALAEAVARHRTWMLDHGTTTFESKSGYGLDRETELASLRAIRRAGGIPTWLGAHAVPPEFADEESYVQLALAGSGVAAVLLPASALFLDRPQAPARELVDAAAIVALATDFNPGSAFCESLPLVASLAATQLGLALEEILAAVTVNAAHVLGRADRVGRLAPGFDADVVLLDASDWRYLAYHLAGRVVRHVVVKGELA